jgi:hypothetical protein
VAATDTRSGRLLGRILGAPNGCLVVALIAIVLWIGFWAVALALGLFAVIQALQF